MPIEWNDSYDVGDIQLNHQHRRLFALVNQVLSASDVAALRDCVAQLFDYIDEHFDYEEGLMRRAGFPDYDEHVQAHQLLKARLHALSDGDTSSDGYKSQFEALVTDWALSHIPQEDARLADYLSNCDTRKADL